jgi:AbiV family abortive infection protein
MSSTSTEQINFEKFILNIFLNATQKILSSVNLYNTKHSYNESYFYAVISQEEMAKLVILPLACELDELDGVLKSRRSPFYNHSIKQKVFTTFGLQNRTYEDIEEIKQSSLYVGINNEGQPVINIIKPEIVLEEIKHSCLFLVNNYQNLKAQESFSSTTHKGLDFFMKIVYECIKNELPEINKMITEDSKSIDDLDSEDLSNLKTKRLFMNPYNLIGMFKAVFKKDYKKHLKIVSNYSFEEIEEYLETIDENDLE